MAEKQWLTVALALVSVVSLLLVACAAPAPAPMPTPTRQQITISAGATGTIGNVMSYALTEMINKQSSWLKASIVEEPTGSASVIGLNAKPETRKNTVVGAVDMTVYQSKMGTGGCPNAWMPKWIARYMTGACVWVTLDPKIRTPGDWVGKVVHVGPTANSAVTFWSTALAEIAGVTGKFKAVYLDYGAVESPLVARTISVAALTSSQIGPNKFGPSSALLQLMSTQKENLYFMDLGDSEAIAAYQKKTGQPIYKALVPAGSGHGNRDSSCEASFNGWICGSELSDQIVSEIMRILWDNYGGFKDYHVSGEGITREGYAQMPWPEGDWHPAALKFYKEKGIKIGL